MAKIEWDKPGEHVYETGVDHGVLYVYGGSSGAANDDTKYKAGVPWNGLTSVSESSEGGEPSAIYADDIKYLNLISAEDIKATIEAYTYPDEFAACEGRGEITSLGHAISIAQQSRTTFGLCYRTKVGNDQDGDNYTYKLHLLYNCLAAPSERSYQTINDSPEAISFSWEISTTPEEFKETYNDGQTLRPTALLTIDSSSCTTTGWKALNDALFGTNSSGEEPSIVPGTDPYLPTPDKVIELLGTT